MTVSRGWLTGRPTADSAVPDERRWSPCRARRVLVRVELLTGGSALVCGALLAARPDGSLMGMPTRVLIEGPFADWRLPGLLLGGLVGAGYLTAGAAEQARCRGSDQLSVLAGAGLAIFEAVEWRWLGFHPLQAVFTVVGAVVAGLAVRAAQPATGDLPPGLTAGPVRGVICLR